MITNIVGKTKKFVKDHGGTILAILGSVGVVATAICSSVGTKKALSHIREAEGERNEPLTSVEKVDVAAMDYVPTVLTGMVSIACILGSDKVNRKRQAAIIGAYTALNHVYQTYRDKVKEIDAHTDKEAMAEVIRVQKRFHVDEASDKNLFFEPHYGDYFEASPSDVANAELHVNRLLARNGYATLSDFFKILGIHEPGLENVGWSYDDGVDWIDFVHEFVTVDENLECCCLETASPVTYI